MTLMKTTTLLSSILIFAMAVSVGCGKKNESGKGNANPYYSQFGLTPGYPAGVGNIPGSVSNPYAQQIFQYLPCLNGQQRIGVGIGLNMSVAVNATYVGITSEGDIAIVSSSGGQQAILSAYVCMRQEFGNGQLAQPQVAGQRAAVGRSLAGCLVDEVSAATLQLPTYNGYPLTLNFRPIHYGVPGYPQFSQALQAMGCR